MLGFLFLFISSILETLYMRTLSKSTCKYFLLSFMLMIMSFINLGFLYFSSENFIDITKHNLRIFYDPFFYINIIVEILAATCMLLNYKHNGKNLTAINFSLFLSVIIIPIFVLISQYFGIFQNSITIKYNNLNELFIFIGSLLILIIIYFYDKIKFNGLNNLTIFLISPLLTTFALYLAINMLQTYSQFFYVFVILFILSLNFLFFSFMFKEKERFKKNNFKTIGIISLIALPAIPLNSFGLSMLPVELATIFKRLTQLLSGIFFDYYFEKKINLKLKDIVVIILIFSIAIYFNYFR